MNPIRTRPGHYDLELHFRRAFQRVPVRQRPSLRAWLRHYRRRHTRTFHELAPATGHWRRL